MKPLEILRNEHGLIRHFLDNLALAVEKIQKAENPPSKFFENSYKLVVDMGSTLVHL